MIKKVVKVISIDNNEASAEDLKYWLSKSPEERVEAVDYLRKQYYGSSKGLQRVVRIIQRPQR